MEYTEVKNLGIIGTGNTPSMKNPAFYDSPDIPFFKPSDISDNITKLSKSEYFISNNAREKARIFPKGTVLCTCIGIIGKIGIVQQESACNQQINYIIPNKNFVSAFIAYSLKFQKQKMIDIGKDAPIVPIINKTKFEKIQIPICSLTEQKRIVAELDNIEAGIRVKQEQLKALDELIQSRFTEMFESNSYEVKPIREIVANNIQTTKKVFKKEDTIQYIDISSIDNLQHSITGTTPYIVADAPSRAQQYIQYNDILVSTVRPNLKNIAINKYQDTNLIASSGFCVLRPEKCAPEYLLYNVLSNEFTTKMISLTTGASYPAVRDNDVLNYAISVPPLPLQNQFAEFVQKVEKAKEIVKIQIKDLQELLALKMDEYFK